MKKIINAVAISYFSLFSMVSNAETLSEIINHVLETHPEIEKINSDYQGSLYNISQIESGYLPTIDVSGEIGQQKLSSPSTRAMDNDARVFSPYDIGISIKQNIFNGFKTDNKVIGSKFKSASIYLNLITTKNRLALATSEAFIKVLQNKNILHLAEENLQLHEDNHIQIKKMFDQGLSSESDLSQIEGRLSQARSFLLTAKQEVEKSLNKYKSIVNKDAYDLEEPEFIEIPFENIDVAIEELSSHPLLLSSKEKINIAKTVYEEGKGNFYPTVDFSITHNRSYDQSGSEGHEEDNKANLTFGYNLFRGGADRAIFNESATQLEAVYAEHQKLYRELLLKLENSWQEYETLVAKKKHLLNYERNTERTLESYKKQFNLGQRTLLDVLNSANELFQARRNIVSLYYDLYYSRLQIIDNAGNQFYN